MDFNSNYEEFDYLAQEPTTIKGNGNIVLHGVTNRFSTDLPPKLLSRIAPEEYKATVRKINSILEKTIPRNFKWFLCGCLFICCTLGTSLLPSIYLTKHTRWRIERLLAWENERLYNKLGLNWSLRKQYTGSPAMLEYILVIEILPQLSLYWPD
ncbi:hypothetical protein WA026_003444 [Henosepilachna vigintioctopunctata]|uniref:Golgin subfamily A member 7/ERF4 domain-containing protein n=1 Tax=Henosepilachna vigintioctopunctata TaxID=420089 RepID=A0AAW1TIE4_9CUCU